MPRRRRLYANCQLILYELRPNSPGGGYMPTTTRRRLYANCQLILYELRPNCPGGGYMPRRRRLYANKNKNAVSRSDPLQGSDKKRGNLDVVYFLPINSNFSRCCKEAIGENVASANAEFVRRRPILMTDGR